jgi:hypothetical protein
MLYAEFGFLLYDFYTVLNIQITETHHRQSVIDGFLYPFIA